MTAPYQKSLIEYAFAEIERFTCISFRKGNNAHFHNILITNFNGGCNADVGYQHKFNQKMNLDVSNCMNAPTIVHEFLHSLGFLHQHAVPNRDLYVTIHYENIDPVNYGYFTNFSSADVTDLGYPYDYTSIMHYRPYEFSTNGRATITAKDPAVTMIGQLDGLNPTDIAKINKLYNCFYYHYNYRK